MPDWYTDPDADDVIPGGTFTLGIQPVELKQHARTIVKAGPAQREFFPRRLIIPSGSGATIHAIRSRGVNALSVDVSAMMFSPAAGLVDLGLPSVPVGGCLEVEVSTMKTGGETFTGSFVGEVGAAPERDLLVEEAEKKMRDLEAGSDG